MSDNMCVCVSLSQTHTGFYPLKRAEHGRGLAVCIENRSKKKIIPMVLKI